METCRPQAQCTNSGSRHQKYCSYNLEFKGSPILHADAKPLIQFLAADASHVSQFQVACEL
eukprot:572966-Karenia_brevis.AAC.1